MTRDELVQVLRRRDALSAAGRDGAEQAVSVIHGDEPTWLVDGDEEGALDAHRAAHAGGTPTVATVAYGEGVSAEATADRLIGLAELAAETGLLRAVALVPAAGERTPGSWGVEDLTVVAAARRALPDSVRVRPSWSRLGAQTCGVALAFGADELVVPEGERTNLDILASAVGRRIAAP